MAILVKENGRLFQLQTKDSSYQMYADEKDVLLHTYYGKRIESENLSDLIFQADVGFSGNPPEAGEDRTYSLDCLPQELAGSGVGDYRQDCIRIRHGDGSVAADFRFAGYKILQGSLKIPGMPSLYDTEKERGQTLVIAMKERASDLVVYLYYGIFEDENVITRSLRVENCGKEAVVLEQCLSLCLDFQYGDYDLVTFCGRHAMERRPERNLQPSVQSGRDSLQPGCHGGFRGLLWPLPCLQQ